MHKRFQARLAEIAIKIVQWPVKFYCTIQQKLKEIGIGLISRLMFNDTSKQSITVKVCISALVFIHENPNLYDSASLHSLVCF